MAANPQTDSPGLLDLICEWTLRLASLLNVELTLIDPASSPFINVRRRELNSGSPDRPSQTERIWETKRISNL